jgi:hypothetical protein
MFDFYQQYWLPYGELLTDMERAGIQVPEFAFAVCSALPRRQMRM